MFFYRLLILGFFFFFIFKRFIVHFPKEYNGNKKSKDTILKVFILTMENIISRFHIVFQRIFIAETLKVESERQKGPKRKIKVVKRIQKQFGSILFEANFK